MKKVLHGRSPADCLPYNVSDAEFIVFGEKRRPEAGTFGAKKRSLTFFRKLSSEKESGIELLSRSQICSTIVAGPLIDRVRDGNVSCKPAIDTGKKGIKMQMEGEAFMWLKCG